MTPEVTSVMNYTVNMGDTVTFECVATGIPAPSITWFRDGTELSSARVTVNSADVMSVMDGMGDTIYQSTRTLSLGMTEDGDSGGYECRASNAATPGEDQMPFEVIVQSKQPFTTLLFNSHSL